MPRPTAPARVTAAALALAAALPGAALAELPGLGTVLGTNAADVTKVLTEAGCPPVKFETEKGKIEVKCTETATGKRYEFYIDPQTGAVSKIEMK